MSADRKTIKLKKVENLQEMLQNISNDNYQIIEIKNFLTDSECDELVEFANQKKYQTSLTTAGLLESHRKSNQIWINDSEHHIVQKISDLSTTITGITQDHMEPLQMLRYGVGEYFYEHYDAYISENPLVSLDRIYTIIIYLNNGYKGGITHFNKLNYNVKPEKGKAVIFKSLINAELPTLIDKSQHQGCEVYSGTKYICNKWIRIKTFNNPLVT